MKPSILQTASPDESLNQALSDLDVAKIFEAIDPRMGNTMEAVSFTETYFTSDPDELRERLALLCGLKSLCKAERLQTAIDLMKKVDEERNSLRLSSSRLPSVLFSWRLMQAYITAVEDMNALLEKASENTSARLTLLKDYVKGLQASSLYASFQKAVEELSQLIRLPRYIHVGLNVREDGFPVEMGVLRTEGQEAEPLNALLCASDTASPSNSLGPEFVYNRSLYGSHFDEYLTRNLEYEWRGPLAKAEKIVERLHLSAEDTVSQLEELPLLARDLSFYQEGLLVAEAFEDRGYPLCRPQVIQNGPLEIKNALYPDFILHHTGIQGNDLTLRKGSAVMITGPNHSGKTSYLKTIGQCYVLAQLGFEVPCDSMRFEPVRHLYTLFSSGEDSSMTKSRMGMEVEKLSEILRQANDSDLVLLNEPMTSTNPVEAVSICADLTQHFLEKGITHLLVTHLYDVYFLLKAKLPQALLERLESLITQSYYDEKTGAMVHSYRLIAHEPLGNSYARETAAAYRITLDDMLESGSLRAQAQKYLDEHNIDSIYEGGSSDGTSDNHGSN